MSLNNGLAKCLSIDGQHATYNPVSDLNGFYNGIGLFNSPTLNLPGDGWYLVISSGVPGTTCQRAVNLFGGGVCHRYCASSNWSSWEVDNYLPTSASCNKNWNWSGRGGQPSYLWGGEDGTNMYVYNPLNFTVFRCTGGIQKTASNLGAGLNENATIFRTYDNNGTVLDNKIQLGSGGSRFKQLFAATATISTSDKNLKKDIRKLDERYLNLFLQLVPVSFQFIDGESGRTHVGYIAQDVENAMAQCGITALDFAGFCKNVKVKCSLNENGEEIEETVLDKNGNPTYIYSLRYEEFIPIITFAVQKLWEKVSNIELKFTQLLENKD